MNGKELFVVLLVVLLAASVSGCEGNAEAVPEEPARPVRAFIVPGKGTPVRRTFPGKVKAGREAELAFRVAGKIVALDVKEGDVVEKGRLVAMLDQRDYKAAVADLEAKLAGVRAVLKENALSLERNKKLLAGGMVAQSALDAAQSAYDTSKADVRSLEHSLERAELNLQYTRLVAPFSGRIAEKYTDNHEFVAAKDPIVRIEDDSTLDVVVDIPENVWVRVFKGGGDTLRHVRAVFEAYPGRAFPLRMKEFQTKATPDTQTYEATLTMPNPKDVCINSGMTAEVTGETPDRAGGASVNIPFSSVFGEPKGDTFVWVLGKDGTVRLRKVEVGRIMDDMFLVEDGIAAGETVIAAGVHALREGQKVNVIEGRIGARK